MTLNDLEAPKQRILVIFLRFSAEAHIFRLNCAAMAESRLRQLNMKFTALNVDFNCINFDRLGLRSFPYGAVKFEYSFKIRDFYYYAVI